MASCLTPRKWQTRESDSNKCASYKSKFLPPAITNVPAEIEFLLARSEKGEWQAWCWLNLVLMFTPNSPVLFDGLELFHHDDARMGLC